MRRVAIVHPLFSVVGGAEKLALDMAKVLEAHGWGVDIYTLEADFGAIERIVDGSLKTFRIKVLRGPVWLRMLRSLLRGSMWRLQRILIYEYFWKYIKMLRSKYDIVIETQSNIPSPADISYLHEPGALLHRAGGVYGRVLGVAERMLLRHGSPRLALTNSTWTRMLLKKVYGIDAEVLHPPVDVEFFSQCSDGGRERLVVTITRFEPQKKIEKIIYIAKYIRDYQFIIIGSMQGERSRRYVNKLKSIIERLGVDNHVTLMPNASRRTLREALCRAQFYLHPPYPEYFGIAVAEAMAAGTVPIVYRRGGAWTDLVAPVSARLGYRTLSEAAEIIVDVGSNSSLWETLSQRAKKIASTLDISIFSEKLISIVESLVN